MNKQAAANRTWINRQDDTATLVAKERLDTLIEEFPELELRVVDYYLYNKEWLKPGATQECRPKESSLRQPITNLNNSDYALRFRKRCLHLLPAFVPSDKEAQTAGCSAFQCSKRKSCNNYWEQFGIHSRMVVTLDLDEVNHWLGAFTLYSRLGQVSFHEGLKSSIFLSRLKEVSEELFCLYLDEVNPYINFTIVNIKALKIIELLSKGKSTRDISELLFMTERGVMYHIDCLKEKVGAKNRVHLVSYLYRNKLII